MGCFILSYLFSTLISLVSIGRLSEQEKDLAILLLRHQLSILERKLDKPVKPNRAQKLTLAVLTARLRLFTRRPASGLGDVIRIVQSERWVSLRSTQPTTAPACTTCGAAGCAARSAGSLPPAIPSRPRHRPRE